MVVENGIFLHRLESSNGKLGIQEVSLGNFLHHFPGAYPYLQEFAFADRVTFSHSLVVTELAQQVITQFAVDTSLPPDKLLGMLKAVEGGPLHDFGKLGITQSVDESIATLHSSDVVSPRDAFKNGDQRARTVRAIHGVHSVVGGHMILELGKALEIPKETAKRWVDLSYSHHELFNGTHSTNGAEREGYPRRNHREENSHPLLAKTIFGLCDIAEAMYGVREYRTCPYDIATIWNEVKSAISDDLLSRIFPHTNPYRFPKFREYLSGLVMSKLAQITTPFNRTYLETKAESLFPNDKPHYPTLIQNIVSRVWSDDDNRQRFMSTIEKNLKNGSKPTY